MGYWTQSKNGESFGQGGGTWGDSCADAFDEALRTIVDVFQKDIGRLPSLNEIRYGLEFSLSLYKEGGWEDTPKLPTNPPPEPEKEV